MATVINNPSTAPAERTVDYSDNSAGWAVAVIILLVVLAIGGFMWMRYRIPAAAPASNGGANINVTLPDTSSGNTNPSGTSGGTQQPATPQ